MPLWQELKSKIKSINKKKGNNAFMEKVEKVEKTEELTLEEIPHDEKDDFENAKEEKKHEWVCKKINGSHQG